MSSGKRVVPSHVTIRLIDLVERPTRVETLPFVIGRREGDLLIEHSQVSGRHAMLDLVNGAIQVTDLGSANGTHVNGFQIIEPTPLKNGDQLGIGSINYTVQISVLKSEQPHAVPDPNATTYVTQAKPRVAPVGEDRRVVLMAATDGRQRQFQLLKRISTVGRGECDVSIPDTALSRKHFQIEVYGDGFGLKDLASANGTFVNGKPISYLRVPSYVTFTAGGTTFHLFLE